MIVVMRATATKQNIDAILDRLAEHQLKGHLSRGEERTIIGVVGAAIPPTLREELELFDGVQEAVRITRPYKLAAREFHPPDTVVDVRGVKVGGGAVVVIGDGVAAFGSGRCAGSGGGGAEHAASMHSNGNNTVARIRVSPQSAWPILR